MAGDKIIVLLWDMWLSKGDIKRIGVGDCTWALMAEVGVYGLKGEKDWVGVETDRREWAPALSTDIGRWRMLLNGNSGGWSECVGDAGQSYQAKEKKVYS